MASHLGERASGSSTHFYPENIISFGLIFKSFFAALFLAIAVGLWSPSIGTVVFFIAGPLTYILGLFQQRTCHACHSHLKSGALICHRCQTPTDKAS